MLPYVRGQRPIIVHADELRQIKSALQWAATNHYKIVLRGRARRLESSRPLLAQQNVPVIYSSVYSLPSDETETYDLHYKAPQLLHQAGRESGPESARRRGRRLLDQKPALRRRAKRCGFWMAGR